MRIGVTIRFQNSYFSGGIPQVACALSRTFAAAGHDVTLLYPKGESAWFIDVQSMAAKLPPRREWSSDQSYDAIVEVVWALPPDERKAAARNVISFVHHPPIFHDIESSVYNWNPTKRSFENLSAIWTYDIYSDQDTHYLEFLSGVPVYKVPYLWDADFLDVFVAENAIPEWSESAARVDKALPSHLPKTIAWSARVMESNFSNTSHCVIPLNIISQIRAKGDHIRFTVHNGENTANNNFFKSNIANNLMLPDISGNMVPRVRLPDLRREKVFIVGHQRFRPIKNYLLDAVYLGIPMVHNCMTVKTLGAPYYYELNQIQQAQEAWKTLLADYEASTGFFNPKAHAVRQSMLRARFGPAALASKYDAMLKQPMGIAAPRTAPTAAASGPELRVAFCKMWDDFQPKHNFFMYLLAWIGKQNGIRVVHDDVNPNLVFFGPLSDDGHKYPGVPKVYYTGENAPPNRAPDTILNIGFNYDTSPNYIRLPLWVLEINWWNGNVDKMVNPKPVALKDAMTVDPALLDSKQKFCAFVATNPNQQNRNAAFHILNRWRSVDAGGRLFCNLPGGPIPAGRGGGGGELAKLEFYKKYKFALTFENSASPGYTTEKLFHAKVAGCVPIYWGDQFVDRDFDSRGFINANQASTPEALIQLVDKIASNPEEWRKMAAVPALSEFKKRWCEKTMEEVARYIFKRVLGKDTKDAVWDTAAAFGAEYESPGWGTQPIATPVVEPITQVTPAGAQPPSLKVSDLNPSKKRIFVTAANSKFVESAVNVLASLRNYEPTIEKIVYVWPDVKPEHIAALQHCGATSVRVLPTTVASETPWADFWEPKHYAWKLWVHNNMIQEAEFDTSILYLDAGVAIAAPLDRIWKQIDERGVFLLDDDQQTNVRWCHPRFCEIIQATPDELAGNQITGGLIGYKKGHPNVIIAEKALAIARDHRDAIVGEKWSPYSAACMGHRHDQSILSVLTHRAGAPRLPLREFYTDKSMRDARMRGLPLYVHRGQYREMVQFADGIDEAYVINLDRRPDRMTRFGDSHAYMKDRVYRWSATDGKSITLTPELTHLFRNNDFNWKKAVMGCALSHMRLWEKLANDKVAKRYLILEDDVKFGDKWLVQWMQSVKHIPEDADVIYLGGILPPNKAAFPQAIEKVNDWFGRVGLNTIFSPPGSPPRKYFHFCNYAYILTQTGARKLMHIIQQAGIFTSGDHMIVNNGNFLNIYFTTPLVATCFQEDDPVYQRSEFNNFERVDNFDSDLWNNTDKFSPEEVQAAAAAKDIRPPAHSNSVTTSSPAAATAAPTHEEAIQVWNNFLRQVAFKHEVADSLESIFRIWNAQTAEEFNKNLNWFRIFEQLVEQKNPAVMKHATRIVAMVGPLASNQQKGGQALWSKILAVFAAPAPTPAPAAASDKQVIYYLPPINPSGIYETEWLTEIFQKPIEWKLLENSGQLAEPALPVLLMQNIPGRSLRDFMPLFDVLEMMNKKVIVLHLSDEHGRDDIDFYGKSSVKHVLRNYWRPKLDAYGSKVTIIPLGYTNERSGANSPHKSFTDRTYVWGFAGSADREGRPQALHAMRKITPFRESTKATWSIPNMLNGKQYGEMMDDVKFVPCFRGMWALESYRLYEALEHGAIPIYIPSESNGVEDEWKAMYGPHPILGFPSWEKAAEMLPMLMKQTDVMERHRTNLREWWTKKKTEVKQHIASLLA